MASEVKVTDNILTAALEKWGNKKWFQGLFIGVVIYLLLAPVLSPIISSSFTKENTSSAVEQTLDERDRRIKEGHALAFEKSRQTYTILKREMNNSLNKIDCDYLFMMEYHNGTENAITGAQFCKFDLTIECTSQNVQYVQLEKFRDDIVVRYDVLLNEEFNKNDFLLVNATDFEKVDRYFAYQVQSVDAKSYAILNLKDREGRVFGSLLCISTRKEPLNIMELYKLGDRIEKICIENKPKA